MKSRHFSLYGPMALLAFPGLAHAQTAPVPAPTPAPAPAPGPAEKSNELVVTGTRSDVIASPDRVSFNVTNDLQVQTGTVADALRAVPGVEVDLQGRVSLRGDPGVTILVDGRPSAMMRGDARGDVLLSMPAGQIERVEVIANPSAAFSPEGSGGVINLVSKQAKRDTRSATVRATLGTQGRAGINLSAAQSTGGLTMTGDLGYRRFASDAEALQLRERFDPVAAAFVPSRLDARNEIAQSAATGRFALDYDLDKQNRLSSEISYRDARGDIHRTDRFTAATPAGSYTREADTDVANRSLGLRASWRRALPGSDHELTADLEFERSKFDREILGVTTNAIAPPAYERIGNSGDRDDLGLKLDYKRPMGEGQSLNIGYKLDRTQNSFDYVGARGPAFDALAPVASLTNRFDYDQTVHALYGTYQFELGKLEVQTGLRLEQADMKIDQITSGIRADNGYFRAYPTLHLGYELAAKQRLRGSYSRRIQRPSPQDLNPYTLYVDPQNVRRGNPSLLPEVTDSVELAWQLRDGGTFYSVTGFYRQSRGGVTDVFEDLGGGVFLTTRGNLARGRRAGVELVANGKFSKTLSYNASGTFLWNEIDTRQAGILAPRSGTTGTVRANLSWQPTTKDFFQLNGVYSGQQLLAQGYRNSNGVLNLGYRRKINDRFSLVLTAQDILSTAQQVTLIDTPTIRDRVTLRGMGRVFMVSLAYTVGSQAGKKRPEPGFEFDQGGGTPGQ